MKEAEASIKVLLEDPTKETSTLIREAETKHVGLYSFSVHRVA